jgi:hypothetical protein
MCRNVVLGQARNLVNTNPTLVRAVLVIEGDGVKKLVTLAMDGLSAGIEFHTLQIHLLAANRTEHSRVYVVSHGAPYTYSFHCGPGPAVK